MKDTEDRQDPEAILNAVQRAEINENSGKLTIFFGMSAGVGKTYEMLRRAKDRLAEGVDVVIGIIYTHGRKETESLVEGIPQIPCKVIEYKNTSIMEMDLEKILERHPQLVLVDELAHSNAPGSRHLKRWQDIIELLDHGIDVYTTVNVQHIESQKDIVETITGVAIREMVPDSIIDLANEIKLIDVTPQQLLERLKEGKVYLGVQAEVAARNFFQRDKLTALREIALRLIAEKVDHDLHGMLVISAEGKEGWKVGERLMVAISHSPSSQYLIRAARRLAFNLDCPWIAVHVDDGVHLSLEESDMLAKNTQMARELGAEVITTSDPNIVQAVCRIALDKKVTQIILGRSPSWKIWNLFTGGTLLDQLAAEGKEFDLHVVHQEPTESVSTPKKTSSMYAPSSQYLWTVILIALLTVVGFFVEPLIGVQSIGFIFLLGVLSLSLFVDTGPVMIAALLSTCIWTFFFLAPFGTESIQYDDIVLCIIYFCTASTIGILTNRIRKREALLRHNEAQTQTIYEIIRMIASAPSSESLIADVEKRLAGILYGECEILLKDYTGNLVFKQDSKLINDLKEQGVATWVFQNNKIAGWSTATLASMRNIYLPIHGFKETIGVLCFHPLSAKKMGIEGQNFLYSILQPLGTYFERWIFEENKNYIAYLKQIEHLRQSILSSIVEKSPNHPISNLVTEKITKDFSHGIVVSNKTRLIQHIEESSGYIQRIVNNVLIISELKTGLVEFKEKLGDLRELVDKAVNHISAKITQHTVRIECPQEHMKAKFDRSLMQMLICNLILNASFHSPIDTEITVKVERSGKGYLLSVTDDRSYTITKELLDLLKTPCDMASSQEQEISIEWFVAKAIAERHKGWMSIENNPHGGITCSVYLPSEDN